MVAARAASPNLSSSWARGFQNLPQEHDLEPLRVEGKIPADIDGTFYRNGIGQVERAGVRYRHWFDGDGAVTAVSVTNGMASGGVRMVRTPGFEREQRRRRPLYGGYNTPLRRPIRELFLGDRKNPANTSVLIWQGRLFAICEAGRPFELDPRDLTTLGERDLDGVILRAFSAHPHPSPRRRAIFGFGITNGPTVAVTAYELPASGSARRVAQFMVKGPLVLHDFAVTERFLIFSVPPLRMQLLPVLLRRSGPVDAMKWEGDLGTEIIVIPIDAPDAMFRVTVEAHLSEHVVNAFERGEEVCFDFTRYTTMRSLEDYVGGLIDGVVRTPLASTLSRCIVDVPKRSVRFEELSAEPCELPRVAPDKETSAHRFIYAAGFANETSRTSGIFDALKKFDVDRGTVETVVLGHGQYPSEAIFIPRGGDRAAEDDGYLLTLVYDGRLDRSHVAILDARALDAGPVARAWFDHAIPHGFHGQWVPRGA
jgi:all-trans-8'-apo-beta-carotenal 15,15'-oxygenase